MMNCTLSSKLKGHILHIDFFCLNSVTLKEKMVIFLLHMAGSTAEVKPALKCFNATLIVIYCNIINITNSIN